MFFLELCSCSMLNEGTTTLECTETNWHRGGRWWWGGDWLSCHLLQRHELISVPQSNHTCSTCVILTSVTPMCTHPLTHTPQRSLTHMPPYTSLPSPLVSMMCAAEAFANCQRLSAWLHSERRGAAKGFWQRDTAQTNGRLVGPLGPITAYYSDAYRHWCTVHVSRLFYLQCYCLPMRLWYSLTKIPMGVFHCNMTSGKITVCLTGLALLIRLCPRDLYSCIG